MTIRLLFGLAVLILATVPANLLALSRDADRAPVDNTHGAPLFIALNNETLTLQNHTQKSVESYRLACFRNDHLSIERRFPLQKVAIPASLTIQVPTILDGPDHLRLCQKLRAKLTVMEVTFADGTAWRLADSFSQSPNLGLPTPSNQNLDYIDNSPNAPLTLTTQGMSLTIHNSSNETVQSYQLGCIRNQPHLHILHRFPPQQSLIQPAAEAWQGAFDSPPDEVAKCQDLKAKLTVLRATFENGTTWHLSHSPSATK